MAGSDKTKFSMSSLNTCEGNLNKPGCTPTTLKTAAGGLEYGVTSMRWLPGANYYEIPQVTEGDEKVWDYTKFNKAGTTWPALNEAFFVLYDITLDGPQHLIGLPVLSWNLGKYYDRNADLTGTAPAGMVNVGPAYDATMPGPVFMAPGEAQSGGAIAITPSGEYSPHGKSFKLYTHENLGFRVGYVNSHSVSLQLQKNTKFSNTAANIPLYWRVENFFLGQLKLQRVLQYDRWLAAQQLEIGIDAVGVASITSLIALLRGCYVIYTAPQMDTSTPWSDKPCS